jgi:hypothetical protein
MKKRILLPLLSTLIAALPIHHGADVYSATLPQTEFSFGYAGTIIWHHADTHPIALSCNGPDGLAEAGELDAEDYAIIHPSLPCGSQAWIVNPDSGLGTVVTVAGNNVQFTHKNRVADMTPAVARAIGVDTTEISTHVVALAPLPEDGDQLAVLSSPLPPVPTFKKPLPDMTEASYAAKNGWAEANGEGLDGMAAVVFVTKNRANLSFGNRSTIMSTVMAPYQFSWTMKPGGRFPAQGSRGYARWADWQETARDILVDQHSGEVLGLQYALGPRATHFYAPKLIAAPKWARSDKLAYIALPEKYEASLGHRFFALNEVKPVQVAMR